MTRKHRLAIITFAVTENHGSAILENDTAKRDKAIKNSQISERETPGLRRKRDRFGERTSGVRDTDKGLNIRV